MGLLPQPGAKHPLPTGKGFCGAGAMHRTAQLLPVGDPAAVGGALGSPSWARTGSLEALLSAKARVSRVLLSEGRPPAQAQLDEAGRRGAALPGEREPFAGVEDGQAGGCPGQKY